MTAVVHIDEAALQGYRRLAEESPRRYRAYVTLMAIAGDCMLTLAQIAPIVLPMAFGILLYPHPWFIWMGVAAAVFFVWINRPQLRPSGRKLERAEAPALFAALDSMRERLQVPGPIEIRLDDVFNASAGEGRGLFGLLGTRRVLMLGLPFLACLSKEDVLGVVAHELGHFSRRHGLLGNWLYRAQMGWSHYAQLDDGRTASPFERATQWYARRFAPRFLTLALVHSRSCEYEADRDAAVLVGDARFAHALTRVTLISERGWAAFERELNRWKQTMPTPPADFHARLRVEIDRQIERNRDDWIGRAVAVASSWHDTHPSLADRLAALGKPAGLGPAAPSAGEELLGADWSRLVAEFDAKWHADQLPAWRMDHLAHELVWASLLSDEPGARIASRGERLLRARALRSLDPALGLEELERLHREAPDDGAAAFSYAAALLREDRSAGAEIMRGVAEREAALSEKAYARLYDYARRISDPDGEKRWGRRWQLASAALATSGEAAIAVVRAGKAQPSRLAAGVMRFLEKAVRSEPAVVQAWLVCATVTVSDGRELTDDIAVHVLMLQLDTQRLREAADTEDKVRERYRFALTTMLPSKEAVLSLTFLTTEALPSFVGAYPGLVMPTQAGAADAAIG